MVRINVVMLGISKNSDAVAISGLYPRNACIDQINFVTDIVLLKKYIKLMFSPSSIYIISIMCQGIWCL